MRKDIDDERSRRYDHQIEPPRSPRRVSTAPSRNARSIWAFAIGQRRLCWSLTILAVQLYFDKIWEQGGVREDPGAPERKLQMLHDREDWNLTHYGYIDKNGWCGFPWIARRSCSCRKPPRASCSIPASRRLRRRKNRPLPLRLLRARPGHRLHRRARRCSRLRLPQQRNN